MTTRTNFELTVSDTTQSYAPIVVPLATAVPSNGLRNDLVKVEDTTQLHIAVIHAHEQKAETFIEVNMNIANKSADAFKDYAYSSEARVTEARGMMFEKDIQLVEHHFRQSFFDNLSSNVRDTARQTGQVAATSVMPPRDDPPKKKGFFARLFDG